MKLYGIDYTERMRTIVASGTRYKLVVLRSQKAVEEKALNVGMELAKAISGIGKQYGKMGEVKFQMEVAEALERIIMGKMFVDEDLGEVVVLENLGILFESELGIDVLRLLRKVSKMALTVLLWPAEIGEDKIYFLNLDSAITLKQTDINYITIRNTATYYSPSRLLM